MLIILSFILMPLMTAMAEPPPTHAPRPRIVKSMRIDVYSDGTARIDARSPGEDGVRFRDDAIPADQVDAIMTEFQSDEASLKKREPDLNRKAAREGERIAVEAMRADRMKGVGERGRGMKLDADPVLDEKGQSEKVSK